MKLAAKVVAIGLTLTASMVMFAQPPGRGGRGAAAVDAKGGPSTDAATAYLSLTDSQLAGLQAIRQTARTASEPVMQQLDTKRQELRTAMNATPVNATAISTIQAAITALRAQLDRIQESARAQMKALLSTAQVTKLATLAAAAALRDEVQGAMRIGLVEGGGPGGPGGRGPGGRGPGSPRNF